MELDKETSRRLEEYQRRTQSRGFTKEYQDSFKKEDNVVCHKPLAPITHAKHETAALYWTFSKIQAFPW
ncbi:uncharacterized protein N7506_004247 [Penicillium brevicompactum]|uniref:uncharacterized protein n=1 Tax=Penicillium brevicompactum TaxID=5074 RepID=UPI00253F804B|nr:uncharacterized protein N7506_004247 [Penicillium brevicompactum]KAJ5336225.1 hypothetical protein N7506_004247 [Penicillium brevicompactum]